LSFQIDRRVGMMIELRLASSVRRPVVRSFAQNLSQLFRVLINRCRTTPNFTYSWYSGAIPRNK